MAKQGLIICGSPRPNGNTMTLCQWTADGARQAGAAVEIVEAAKLKLKAHGCTACMGCQKSNSFRCQVKDDAAALVEKMPAMDLLVFATPVYFVGVSAQIKIVMDRMFSLIRHAGAGFELAPGLEKVSCGLIATAGGNEDSGIKHVDNQMQVIGGFLGRPVKSLFLPLAPRDPRDLAKNAELKAKALAFGRALVAGN
jgi:multimeric flavodoxin WrbA